MPNPKSQPPETPSRKDPHEKQTTVKVRHLKVLYMYPPHSWVQVPRILLQGKWLEAAGFSVYDTVAVTVMDDFLIIKKASV